MNNIPLNKKDPTERELEIKEWLESLRYVINNEDHEHVYDLLQALQMEAFFNGVRLPFTRTTPYINTIHFSKQPVFAGNYNIERQIKSINRWNAMVMVARANKSSSGLGGHIATFASSATLYETGFNHFFKAPSKDYGGDFLYIQGHASPGIYARAMLEGRIDTKSVENFRCELADPKGLPSYPHPRLLPDFWQFPTVSMGLSPIMAIYQARFIKYLENRGLKAKNGGKVWVFVGDGETDEPETLGAINLASRENLDNLIFVINCNLQRLDGPVRGNGKIIQELEGIFRGSGWNVIKVIWGSRWDQLLDNDDNGLLKHRMMEAVDGEYQKYSTADGKFIRENFFGKYPELKKMVSHISDRDLKSLDRGGHDPLKVYAAYKTAVKNVGGGPTVILAKTVKGYGMGGSGEGRNINHQQKSLSADDLVGFRNKFSLPIPDKDLKELKFYIPDADSPEVKYLKQKRLELGGELPARKENCPKIKADSKIFDEFCLGSDNREVSTTMVFVRILTKLLRDKQLSKYIVPIVPDEARTFGMEGLFSKFGIYSSLGQRYEPVDKDSLLYYRESITGQLLEEGITEAGATSSFIAAGTSYANYGIPMIPFYIFYSMFGFQRIADLAWAASDMMCKGFLVGGTAGRTTLQGEGLQHQDGHSLSIASTNPAVRAYDPAYAYELAIIIKNGIKAMYMDDQKIFYYLLAYNENYVMPPMPKTKDLEKEILAGIYRITQSKSKGPKVHLFGSGPILNESIKAAATLEKNGISADVWSVTSYNELRRNALECERHNMFNPKNIKKPYISEVLEGEKGIIVASSDFIKLQPDSIRKWVPLSMTSLGTDGFGRSDNRQRLRYYFEVDQQHIAYAAAVELYKNKEIDAKKLNKIKKDNNIKIDKINPLDI